ncbi:uncharacterized protein LOC113359241 [Papaver somniferum]|uniref:uncharacterized protein LOC113359241 n=1 Tax=Papaver somniferum TaxID=3469 RepID=UPI000E7040D7|nr:uncharacterized protein LOC113359241 [Papaver somniferum]
MVTCKKCKHRMKADSSTHGTGSLNNHLRKCLNLIPKDSGQSTLSFEPARLGEDEKLVAVTFCQDSCRKALIIFIIVDEQPFRIVEGEGFREFCKYEKVRLKNYFKVNKVRVCLTTDTWSSLQKLGYMVITAHWIDASWKLHKKIISFIQIVGHSGETIGRMIGTCLLDWEIENVFTITLDNVFANDVAITYLQNQVLRKNSDLVKGFLQVRCAAHVLALVVKHGMKEYDISIKRIRAVVKYCMSSPARLKKFMDCVAYEKIECKKGLVLDVDTRWNSTFTMLDSAEKYQPAFERLEYEDKAFKKKFCFVESQIPLVSSTSSTSTVDNQPDWDVDENQDADLSSDEEVIATSKRGKKRKRTSSDKAPSAPPLHAPYPSDWSYARAFAKFLKVFFDFTVKFSSSTHVTAHEFLFHVSVIHRTLNTWANHKDTFLSSMGLKMQSKYNEYWGRYEKMNNLMFIVVLLNPQDKELGLKFLLGQLGIGGGYLRTELMDLVMRDFKALFEEYWDVQMSAGNSTVVTDSSGGNTVGAEPDDEGDCAAAALMAERAREEEESFDDEGKNELETYLREKREPRKEKVSFDILALGGVFSIHVEVLYFPQQLRH